jgi:glycosyltransferase involved in cell wall biosynthesis
MRIARLVERLPPARGGKELHVAELTAALAAEGIEQHIFVRTGEALPDVSVSRMPLEGRLGSTRATLAAYCAWAVGAAVSEHRRRPFSLVHAHGDFPEALAAAMLSRALDVPAVLTVHGGLIPGRRHNLVRRLSMSALERVWVVSEEAKATLRAIGISSEVVVRPSGVRDAFFAMADSGTRRAGVITVGRLAPVKGIEHLVAARDRLQGRVATSWTIVGGGDDAYARRIRSEIDRRPDMVCVEVTDANELAARVAGSAVFVLPSVPQHRQHEGVPTALMEAMAAGVPIIASRVGGVHALLEDGRLGELVMPGDSAALANAIERVHRDASRALRRAAEGRTRVERWGEVAAQIELGYRDVLERHRGPSAVLVLPTLEVGGAEWFVLRLAAILVRQGVRTCVAAAPGRLVPELPSGVEFASLHAGRGPRSLIANALTVLAVLGRVRPTAVNAHSYLTGLSTWGASVLAARRARRVLTVHVPERPWYSRVIGPTAPLLFPRVLTVSDSMVAELTRGLPQRARRRFVTVRAGVLRPAPAPCRASSVVVAGRLVPRKGQRVILRAWRRVVSSPRVSGWTLELWGDGPDRAALEKERDRLCLGDSVRFAGFVDQVSERLGGIGLLALPSLREGLPLVLVEAMMAGTPVVASDLPSCRELLGGGAGVLVSPGDADAWSRALLDLISDDARRAALGRAGVRRVGWAFAEKRMEAAYMAELGLASAWWSHEAAERSR